MSKLRNGGGVDVQPQKGGSGDYYAKTGEGGIVDV